MPGVAREKLANHLPRCQLKTPSAVKTQLEWLFLLSPKANQDIEKAEEGP